MNDSKEVQLLKKLVEDVELIKKRLSKIESILEEEVNPKYLEELEKLNKGKFFTREELERELD